MSTAPNGQGRSRATNAARRTSKKSHTDSNQPVANEAIAGKIGPEPAESADTKTGQVRFVPIASIKPSPENVKLYRPVDPRAASVIALARSIKTHGILEPLLLTQDDFILSGHTRFVAAQLAGLTEVPCRFDAITRRHSLQAFTVRLKECNRQRFKKLDEVLREELIDANPAKAYQALIEHRQQAAEVLPDAFEIGGKKVRSAFSKGKQPMIDAILSVVADQREFWPLSDRRIHYALLTDPPVRHTGRSIRYSNCLADYKDLTDVLTRMRLFKLIPMHAIEDVTRPVSVWNCSPSPQPFIHDALKGFLGGYWRDLLQSQPNHIELVIEKNTVLGTLKPIAMEYCIPVTSGRGYCSLPPRHAMYERYRRSGKTKLILLMVSDFDPDGEEISISFAKSMRDDFGVKDIHPMKIAITGEQVQAYNLPPMMEAKSKSANHDKFTAKHGKAVYEVEALPPRELQKIARAAIDSVLDIDRFNAEIDAEAEDAAYLQGVRKVAIEALDGLGSADDGEGAAT